MESRLLKKRIPSDPDLTSGSIVDKVLLFAIPLMLTSMLQQLFNATDVAVVGKFASMEAMAAVGSNTPIVSLLVNFFVGISVGANVLIQTMIKVLLRASLFSGLSHTILMQALQKKVHL